MGQCPYRKCNVLHTENTLDSGYREQKNFVSELDNKMNPAKVHKRVKVLQFDKHLENVTGKGNKDLYHVSGFSFVQLILVWIC